VHTEGRLQMARKSNQLTLQVVEKKIEKGRTDGDTYVGTSGYVSDAVNETMMSRASLQDLATAQYGELRKSDGGQTGVEWNSSKRC
jgi:hypothetical protein